MKFSLTFFLFLYAFQVANTAPLLEELQLKSISALAKRSFFKSAGHKISNLFSHTKGGKSGKTGKSNKGSTSSETSSSSTSSHKKKEDSDDDSKSQKSLSLSSHSISATSSHSITTTTFHAVTASTSHSITTSASTLSSSITLSASQGAAVDQDEPKSTNTDASLTAETDETPEKKENKLKSFSKKIGNFVLEGVGCVILNSNIGGSLFGSSSDSTSSEDGTSSESEIFDVVGFVTTDSTGSTTTYTLTAPASDFTTATNGQVYFKTEAYSDALYYATATTML